jgi:hypothetical protein
MFKKLDWKSIKYVSHGPTDVDHLNVPTLSVVRKDGAFVVDIKAGSTFCTAYPPGTGTSHPG